jgi:DNA relaxase NicK
VTEIDGIPLDDIYRCEVEYKPKHAPLPVDLIDRRDQYFAGSYPFLEHLLDVEPEVFVQRRERGPQLDLDAALVQVRRQYGMTLFTALVAYQGDVTAVWDKIVGRRHNQALVDAGVLLVEHDS